jgi:enoyl-CoA hydratase/carnithine racemase
MRSAEADPDVDVLILTGTDPAFCAGLDLKELVRRAATWAAGPAPTGHAIATACADRSRSSANR